MSSTQLEDCWAILQQYGRFEQAVSDKDFATMASVFTDDVRLENRLGTGKAGESTEQRFESRFADFAPTKIVYCNPLIEVDGDEAHSKVDSLVLEVDLDSQTGLLVTQMGRYYDDWRREDGVWLIYNRKHIEMNPRKIEEAAAAANS
jgi:ketosteroid isomerase-like protein